MHGCVCSLCSTGASRGIGAEIAKALTRRGTNVVVAAKRYVWSMDGRH